MERSQAAFVSQVHLGHILVGADEDDKDDDHSDDDFDRDDGHEDGNDDHILVGADDDGKDDSENDFDEADGDDDGKDGGRSDDDFDGDEVKSYFDSRLLEEQANKFDCCLIIKILPEQLK